LSTIHNNLITEIRFKRNIWFFLKRIGKVFFKLFNSRLPNSCFYKRIKPILLPFGIKLFVKIKGFNIKRFQNIFASCGFTSTVRAIYYSKWRIYKDSAFLFREALTKMSLDEPSVFVGLLFSMSNASFIAISCSSASLIAFSFEIMLKCLYKYTIFQRENF